jgi:recombinational DNA repair ATPase RecF
MMMRCDELIDVSADIKEKRKEMIRNVQAVLAKLESKIPINDQNSNQMETTLVVYDPSINNTESQEEEQTST